MTDFSDQIKEMIKKEQETIPEKEAKAVKKRTAPPEPYFTYEVDPSSKLDVVIKRWNGSHVEGKNKVTHELWLLFSIEKVWMVKDNVKLTDDFILEEDGLKEFFKGVLKKDETFEIKDCKGMKCIQNSPRFIWAVKRLLDTKNLGKCIKEYDAITLNRIADVLYYEYWDAFKCPPRYEDYVRDFPWFFEGCPTGKVGSIDEFFKYYTKNTKAKRREAELEKNEICMSQLTGTEKDILEAIEYFFDLPYACKLIKEYREDDNLAGLDGNCLWEILGLSNDRTKYTARDGYMRFNYNEGEHNRPKDQCIKFEDKKAFWRYIIRGAEEECLSEHLSTFVHKWKNVLAAQMYTYGHITNRYPSRYKYVKDEDGDIVKIPTTNPSLSYLEATMPWKASKMEDEIRDGRLAEILGELADNLECNKIIDGVKYTLKYMRTDADFVEEASNQNNCVNNIYKGRILEGQRTSIASIRKADTPDRSFITVEIDPLDGHIPQALKKNNASLNSEERKIVSVFETETMKRVKKMRNKNKKATLDEKMKELMDENNEDEEE